MGTMSLDEALSKMVESGERPFRITFVRGTGKDAGSIREAVCYYGAPNPTDRQAQPAASVNKGGPEHSGRKKRDSHLESGTVPLTEFGTRKMLTPFIFNLLTFNGHKIYS